MSRCWCVFCACFFFFFNDTATTEIYTLSLHDALPIYPAPRADPAGRAAAAHDHPGGRGDRARHRVDQLPQRSDRKSTRLNSSHANISYAVFCLKKKKRTFSQGSEFAPSHTSHMVSDSL